MPNVSSTFQLQAGGAAGRAADAKLASDGRNLDKLKLAAGQDPKTAAHEAAKQFESLFMGELLKSMRASTEASGMLDNAGTKLGTEMLDAQLVNASGQALMASYAGLLVSYHLDTPSGPTIIGCAGALYFASLLLAPGGWLARLLTTRHRVA